MGLANSSNFAKKGLLFLLLLMSFTTQSQTWKTYQLSPSAGSENFVNYSLVENGNLWCATRGGVVLYDGSTTKKYTTNDGLIDNIVNIVVKDLDGSKWFATSSGVSRFDGTTWTNYTTTNGLISNSVTSMLIDQQGNKWFGSSQGISRFNGTSWTSYTTAQGLSSNQVKYLAMDSKGKVWASTNGYGVCQFNGTSWSKIIALGNYNFNVMTFDKKDTLWAATTGSDVCKYFDGFLTKYNKNGEVYSIRSIAIDLDGSKWLSTLQGNVFKYDGVNWTSYSFPQEKKTNSSPSTTHIAIDGQGIKWCSTENGVFKFGTGWLDTYYPGACLNSNIVYDVAVDSKDHIWFATNQGVSEFDGNTWFNYYPRPLNSKNKSSIFVDHSDNVWLGVQGGVYKFDRQKWTLYSCTDEVTGIAEDNLGNIWVTTGGSGAFMLNGTTLTKITGTNSPSGDLYDVWVNKINNDVWIGSSNQGLYKFNGTSWINYNPANGSYTVNNVGGKTVPAVVTDAQGNVWAAARNGGSSYGVSKLSGSTWSYYSTTNSGLVSYVVNNIAIDSQSNKWFGTDMGVSKFDGNAWVTYNVSNSGLVSNSISGIAIDSKGNRWFTTLNGGVSKFAPNLNPTVSIVSPVNNSYSYLDKPLVITAAAADEDGTITKVEFYNGSQLIGTSTTAPYADTLYNLLQKDYVFKVIAYDNSGGSAVSSQIVVSIVRNNPPVVDITSPDIDAVYEAPADILISAWASDYYGKVEKVEFYNNDMLIGVDSVGSFEHMLLAATAGTYVFTAKAYDNTGLTSLSSPVTVEVKNPEVVTVVRDITVVNNHILYPNPADDYIIVSGISETGLTIVVFDIYGNEQLNIDNVKDQQKVNLTTLQAGLYYVKIGSSLFKIVKK